MITEGKVALFQSREINPEAVGKRDRYGAGLLWSRTDNTITVYNFWLYATPIPKEIRIHLYGTTPENTIGCVVMECELPDAILNLRKETLFRKSVDMKYNSVIEYSRNVEIADDEVIEVIHHPQSS